MLGGWYTQIRRARDNEQLARAYQALQQDALFSVPPDELERCLRHATFDQDGQVIESAELRIISQTSMRIQNFDMVELPAESHFLEKLQLGCVISWNSSTGHKLLTWEISFLYTRSGLP
jgi:hypothetical protein